MPPGEQIRVESRRREGKVCIRFTDTGIGLPAENLESVFEMFSQVHPPGSQGNAGLGIGLSLARRLVEMHGGTIVAYSGGIGRGAEFVVELPALEAQTVAPAHGTRATASAPALRVLVVDDNVDAASSVADLLGALGHEVQVSYDGASAVAEA